MGIRQVHRPTDRKLRCLLLYPEFRVVSFWNYTAACRIKGAKYPAAPLGMLTVAALLPKEWELRLVDRNVETLDDRDIEWADLVMIGGMIAQQGDHMELMAKVKAMGKPVLSGGPDATNSPHIYDGADYLVLGEAEVTMPQFLGDFAGGGELAHIYRSDDQADVTQSPVPRWDLVKYRNYAYLGLQWSRGCPFNCEFCDIIELFGRVPRLKKQEQVLAELDNLYRLGYRGAVDIVDDNFIGNQRDVKKILVAMRAWQEEHGWPFEFGTEASLNLADKPQLLELMQKAGFVAVFVGIETPDEATLRLAQKQQNTKRDIAESVRKIYEYGIMVMAGYIMGFDGEPTGVGEAISDTIHNTAIPVNMVGMLFALPTTQLTRRLESEGRLTQDFDVITSEQGDQCVEGLNFDTTRPKSEILTEYVGVIRRAYTPKAYFGRVTEMALALNCTGRKLSLGFRTQAGEIATFFRMMWHVGLKNSWSPRWWKLLGTVLVRNPRSIRYALWMGTLYTHFAEFSPFIVERLTRRIEHEKEAERTGTSRVFDPAKVIAAKSANQLRASVADPRLLAIRVSAAAGGSANVAASSKIG